MAEHESLTMSLDPAGLPEDIERRSMAIIESEVPEPRPFQGNEWLVARRLVHASADFELLSLLRFSKDAVEAGLAALETGALLVTDTEMARVGIPERRLKPLGCRCLCLMNDPLVVARAAREGVTRARAALDEAAERGGEFRSAIFVVGNAPTALLRLLDHIREGALAPALVVGMPVGFVNAAQSKDRLMAESPTPWIAIKGRKGGSALAASAVNALAEIVLAKRSRA